jgi:nucleotide-binding universal stress UspA family protein
MHKVLVPIDGSTHSDAALRYAIDLLRDKADGSVLIVNIQPSLPGTVSSVVSAKTLKAYHVEEGGKILAKAIAALKKAGIAHDSHVAIGEPAPEIAALVKAKNCDAVVMGSRGLGAFGGMVMGSVATKVVSLVDVPVTLVK